MRSTARHQPGISLRPAALGGGWRPAYLVVRNVAVEDVPRHVEIDRSRTRRERVADGGVHQLGDASGIVAAVGPARDRPEERDLVRFLEGPHARVRHGARPSDGDHGRRVDEGVGDPRDQVRRARTAAGHADRRPPSKPAVGVGHHGGRLFVADIDHPDAPAQAGVLTVDHGAAHEEEDHGHSMIPEAARQDLVAGHRASVRSRPPRSAARAPRGSARGGPRRPPDCAGRAAAPPRPAHASAPSSPASPAS